MMVTDSTRRFRRNPKERHDGFPIPFEALPWDILPGGGYDPWTTPPTSYGLPSDGAPCDPLIDPLCPGFVPAGADTGLGPPLCDPTTDPTCGGAVDPCAGAICAAGEACDPMTGACIPNFVATGEACGATDPTMCGTAPDCYPCPGPTDGLPAGVCGAGQYFNPGTGYCEVSLGCGPGQILDQATGECVDSWPNERAACEAVGMIWDDANSVCIPARTGLPNCGDGMVWDDAHIPPGCVPIPVTPPPPPEPPGGRVAPPGGGGSGGGAGKGLPGSSSGCPAGKIKILGYCVGPGTSGSPGTTLPPTKTSGVGSKNNLLWLLVLLAIILYASEK